MIFVAELQRASKRTDALLCAERLSFIPTISLSLFCGAHELIYPTFICWHNKTRCTLVQIARRSDNCALPTCFLSLGWCLSESMRVTHQMGGRVGGRRRVAHSLCNWLAWTIERRGSFQFLISASRCWSEKTHLHHAHAEPLWPYLGRCVFE